MRLTNKLLLATAGALLLFTGCQDQDVPTLQNGEVALQLSSSVDGLRVTSDNKWESGDAIGVFAPALTASNVQYTTTSTEATADFTATAPIKIPEGTTEYDIQAYYPYKDGVTDSYAITLPVTKPLLYATGKASHAEPKITVAFKHQMAQIQLKISGDGIELTEAGSVELKEVTTTGTLTIADGTVAAGTSKGKLALTSSTFDATNKSFAATAFLIPGENLEEKEFTVTVGDKTYTGKLPAGTATDATTKSIVAGKRYVYTVGLKPAAAATAELKLSQSTIQGPTEETIDTIVGLVPDATPTTPGEPAPVPGVTSEGNGSEENPYNVTQAKEKEAGDERVWVYGYILGSVKDANLVIDNSEATNIILGLSEDSEGVIIPVQLPSGDIRKGLNVIDNPDNIGKKVAVYGKLTSYFKTQGIKSVNAYKFLP